jgi:hypothetical protein
MGCHETEANKIFHGFPAALTTNPVAPRDFHQIYRMDK